MVNPSPRWGGVNLVLLNHGHIGAPLASGEPNTTTALGASLLGGTLLARLPHSPPIPMMSTGGFPGVVRLSLRRLGWWCVVTFSVTSLLAQERPTIEDFDVVVIGGSSGGIGAALGAARMGVKVALIEDTPVLGGMLANGISNIDSYSYASLSGVFEEFRQRVREHYAPRFGSDPLFAQPGGMPTHIDGRSYAAHEPKEGGRWEPHVADQIFKKMAAGFPNLQIFYRRFATGPLMEGRRIVGVRTSTERGESVDFHCRVVVDASHEADIAAAAGAPYRIGREARSPQEPHAGVAYFFNHTGEFLPGSTGRQDHALVSGGLRLCIQTFPEEAGAAHVLTDPPPGYDPANYAHASHRLSPAMPGGKAEMNVNPIGSELQVVNWDWADASRVERQRLYQVFKDHALGYLYYLQHELGRRELGLPLDEFRDNGHVPYRIFIRESRRIWGDETMTEADINPFISGHGLLPPLRGNSIAIGHYPIDAKPVRPKTDLSTPDKGEGDFFLVNVATAFQVPYGAILPRHVDGLLVPVALSATHVAFSSVRMDPTWTVLGQSAGIAAALSVQLDVPPRELPLGQLQDALLAQRVKLAFFWDLDATHPHFAAIQHLTVRDILVREADRRVRPDDPLTRAEAAQMLYRAFQLWPSVSNVHFSDVPYDHEAFREIETLFDHGALVHLGIEPQWPKEGGYDPGRHSGFRQRNNLGELRPDAPISEREFMLLIEHLRAGAGPLGPEPGLRKNPPVGENGSDRSLTRGEACSRIWALVRPARRS